MSNPQRSARATTMVLMSLPLLAACSAQPVVTTAEPTPSSSATDSGGTDDLIDIAELGAATIHAEPFADWLIGEQHGMWVANVDSGLVRMDLMDGTETAEVAVGEIPLALEIAGGALWAATPAPTPEVVRVPLDDPAAAVHIPLPLAPRVESSITSDGTLVWLFVGGPLTLLGLEQSTGAIVRTFEVTAGLQGLRFAGDALWASSPATGELVRLDPVSGEETLRVAVGPQPAFIASGAGSLWVMNQGDGTVSRVDPADGAVLATIPASTGHIAGGDIIATDSEVWVRTTEELAVLVDPAADAVVARLGPAEGSGSIAVGGGAVWLTAHDVSSIHRIPQASITNR
ncbi:hypothetical protein J7E29_17190 [Streptomyces sp. ISL-90]|nr:hypothetical protein [Streptomyces sp. ISL-90]